MNLSAAQFGNSPEHLPIAPKPLNKGVSKMYKQLSEQLSLEIKQAKLATPGKLIATQTLNSDTDTNWKEGGTLKSSINQTVTRPYGWLERFKSMQWLNVYRTALF